MGLYIYFFLIGRICVNVKFSSGLDFYLVRKIFIMIWLREFFGEIRVDSLFLFC